jgi:putative hemolysin
MDGSEIVLAILSLLFAVFFTGVEVAFFSASKVPVDILSRQGNISARVLDFFNERPTWFIGTTLAGNLLSITLLAIIITHATIPLLQSEIPVLNSTPVIAILVTVALTLAVILILEFLCKSLFVMNSHKILLALAIPFAVIAALTFPLAFLIVSVIKGISTWLGLEYSHEKPVYGLTNINDYLKNINRIRSSEHDIELDKRILSNALEFKSVRVRDCMIPRTEITAVHIDATIKQLQEVFIESGHSKILVYRDSIDDAIGYCHSSALFRKPASIEEILTSIVTVPETMLANELMIRLINERKSLAVVVDEFGGTSGLISMEDVIEEIFGEIEDEHDEDDLVEQQIDDKTYLLSARLEIDYLNEAYGWDLPTGDYETLGGLMLEHVSNIPKRGEIIELPGFSFAIESTEEMRINTIRVTIMSPSEQ